MLVSDQRRVRLLDVDPDLGAGLDAATLEQASHFLRLPAIALLPGSWDPDVLLEQAGVQGPVIGCVVVTGLITRDVALGDRICTHLYGPRDFVSLNALELASLPFEVNFGALTDAEVVLLDDRFLAGGQRWPRVMGRMFDTATSQIGRQSADQAIAQLPRVEDRLLALFWHLADRWGTRQKDGIAVGLPLTHEALGRLIGARRPTVSLGLRQLADEGSLRRDGDTWLLSAASLTAVRVDARQRPAQHRSTHHAPVPANGAPFPQDAALRDRLAVLRQQVEAGMQRAENLRQSNRSVRERVARGRASRTAAQDAGSAATA
jgi:CRP/FNR family transcriptional regulator, cyclic AMP receptor protein